MAKNKTDENGEKPMNEAAEKAADELQAIVEAATAELEKQLVELTAARDELRQQNAALAAENKELAAKLAKLQKPHETFVTLPSAMRPIREHGLPHWAGAGQIAKAIGMSLAETETRLAAAAAETPSIKQGETYSIYGMTTWRYLGVEFKTPGS